MAMIYQKLIDLVLQQGALIKPVPYSFTNSFSLLVSNVYPIVASFKAYEEYVEASKKFDSSNINIGGFNVPINTLLKKATGDHDEKELPEATLLVYKSNKVHKWLIFWVVNTTFNLLTSILFIKQIVPFYSLIRLIISVWFVSPMLQIKSIDNYDPTEDWQSFFDSGCGYCYCQFIRPWLNGDFAMLSDLSFDSNRLYDNVSNVLITLINLVKLSPLSGLLQFNQKGTTAASSPSASKSSHSSYAPVADYAESFKTFGAMKLQEYFKGSSTAAESVSSETGNDKEAVDDDYDMIDPPVKTDATGSQPAESEASGAAKKKGWFW